VKNSIRLYQRRDDYSPLDSMYSSSYFSNNRFF